MIQYDWRVVITKIIYMCIYSCIALYEKWHFLNRKKIPPDNGHVSRRKSSFLTSSFLLLLSRAESKLENRVFCGSLSTAAEEDSIPLSRSLLPDLLSAGIICALQGDGWWSLTSGCEHFLRFMSKKSALRLCVWTGSSFDVPLPSKVTLCPPFFKHMTIN